MLNLVKAGFKPVISLYEPGHNMYVIQMLVKSVRMGIFVRAISW